MTNRGSYSPLWVRVYLREDSVSLHSVSKPNEAVFASNPVKLERTMKLLAATPVSSIVMTVWPARLRDENKRREETIKRERYFMGIRSINSENQVN